MTGGPQAPATAGGLRDELAAEVAQLTRELDEIALLAQQAASEAERQEARRSKGEERIAAMESDPRTDARELRELRSQQRTLDRRVTLFQGELQVLQAKQVGLGRYRDRLAAVQVALGGIDPTSALASRPSVGASLSAAPPDRAAILRAQEDLRRDIARQMHDGPAQSLANIALQAEIVQRLIVRTDPRAMGELDALRGMVQHALDATKAFIFEVRPMVLDDLGLVPTLRRTAVDRGRRTGIEIDFGSQGQDRRVAADLESGLFRLIDDALSGYAALRPERILLNLEWSDQEVTSTIRCIWRHVPDVVRPAPPPQQLRDDLPPALRAMIEEARTEEAQARAAAQTLPGELVAALGAHARDLGVQMELREDGGTLELVARISA